MGSNTPVERCVVIVDSQKLWRTLFKFQPSQKPSHWKLQKHPLWVTQFSTYVRNQQYAVPFISFSGTFQGFEAYIGLLLLKTAVAGVVSEWQVTLHVTAC